MVGLAGAWKLGRHLGGDRVGFLALMLLVLTPAYYGHSFNNPKDAPFAGAMVWALYYMCQTLSSLPSPPPMLVSSSWASPSVWPWGFVSPPC